MIFFGKIMFLKNIDYSKANFRSVWAHLKPSFLFLFSIGPLISDPEKNEIRETGIETNSQTPEHVFDC